MADHSKIEWTDRTWNPTVGCDRVSPGCDSCYAIRMAARQQRYPAYEGTTGRVNGRLDWTGRVNTVPDRLADPNSWRKPSMVFVDSMSDLFHADVPDEFIAKVFAVMASTPRHTYQLLTKRHARMRSLLGSDKFRQSVQRRIPYVPAGKYGHRHYREWPLPNVWVGVSVEDQKWADIRIPALLDTPAAVRWLSCEPLLGQVDLGDVLFDDRGVPGSEGIGWVVTGGESGPGARPMEVDWARLLRDQCQDAGVPYFFKQWGEWVYRDQMPDDTYSQLDAAINLAQAHPEPFRVGKKRAGRLLDEREWSEYPEVSR